MDNQLVWDDKYNIGVDIIDKEHKRLFKIINKLFAFGEEEKKSQWACQEGVKYFKEHAMKHFKDEEDYMASIDYKEFETHRRIHKEFRENTLPALEQELKLTNYSPNSVNHFLGVCAGWLIGHTLTEDLAIVGENSSKWIKRLSSKEHTAIEKNIVQLLYNMFHLESHVISETYNGEKFGKGIYYRLVYSTKEQNRTWETFLVFEEQLLINTVGKIMGVKSNKLDTMLINATRYTAQQFVGRVMKYFPSAELYEMKEENLLTHEQFQKIFEKEKLQLSLLFDTGAGYFSYCMIAPHLLEDSLITPVDTKKEVSKVEKYLTEEQEREERKKLENRNAESKKAAPISSNRKNTAMAEIEKYFMDRDAVEGAGASKPMEINRAMDKVGNYFTNQKVNKEETPTKPIEVNSIIAEIEKYFTEKKKQEANMNPININSIMVEIEKYFTEKKANEKGTTLKSIDINNIMVEIEKYLINKKVQEKETIPEPIKTSNAMVEVEKYLTEKKESEKEACKKPKVLVVDDSLTIQQGMKELLNKDYDVSLVKSALSAIRAITLDKPDLILLDYEMPICDGRQVLEMLRSEEEFADVPVIFLTSKTDQESVRKVIDLKPEGYLSKYLKPTDIKKKIDSYFEKRKSLMFYEV